MPGLFTPIEIEGDHYVDGGVLMNLPVSVIRGRCEKVVAVNLSKIVPDRDYRHNVFGILMRTYHLMSHCNVIHDRRNADILIEPTGSPSTAIPSSTRAGRFSTSDTRRRGRSSNR